MVQDSHNPNMTFLGEKLWSEGPNRSRARFSFLLKKQNEITEASRIYVWVLGEPGGISSTATRVYEFGLSIFTELTGGIWFWVLEGPGSVCWSLKKRARARLCNLFFKFPQATEGTWLWIWGRPGPVSTSFTLTVATKGTWMTQKKSLKPQPVSSHSQNISNWVNLGLCLIMARTRLYECFRTFAEAMEGNCILGL